MKMSLDFFLKIVLATFIGSIFAIAMSSEAHGAALIDHTFTPTSSAQGSDICIRTTFTERACVQTFLVPDQQTYVVDSIDVLLSGDDATACNVQGSLLRNNATSYFTAGDWKATSTNAIAVSDNPNAFGVYNLAFSNVVLDPGTYAFVLSLSGTCAGGGHVMFGLATSTNTYSGGEWWVSTGPTATSSNQGSYADRSAWFRVNGAGYTPNTGISILSPSSGSYLTPFSTVIYVSLSQPTTGNLKVISNFPVNGSTTIGSVLGVAAGTYAFPVVFAEKINYQVRAQFYVSSSLYAQSDPKQYQLGGVFYATSTVEGVCSTDSVFASWSGFWCHTTNAVIIPSDSSVQFITTQFSKIQYVFPFSFLFGSLDTLESAILAYQASGTTAALTYTTGNITIDLGGPLNAIQNVAGSAGKDAIFELEKYLAWFAVVIGACAIVKSKA